MKRLFYKFYLIILLVVFAVVVYAQNDSLKIDSVKQVLQKEKEDTNKVWTLINLAGYYQVAHADTGIIYAQQALNLSEKLNFEKGIFYAEGILATSLIVTGNYPLGLDYAFKTVDLAKKINSTDKGWANSLVSYSYYYLGEYKTSLSYIRESMKIAQPHDMAPGWRDLALVFHKLNEQDSAMLYAQKAYEQLKNTGAFNISNVLGDAYVGKGNYDSALFFYRNGIAVAIKQYMQPDLVDCYNNIAGVYKEKNNLDSAVWYCKKVLNEKIEKSYPIGLLNTTNMLADVYSLEKKPDSALKYLRIALTIKDSLFSREKTMAIQNLAFKNQEKQKEVEAAKLQWQNQLKMYVLLGGLFIVLAIAGILFRNNKQKQKANTKIEKAYAELKSTQQQLVQSEKMASLGELTAGIAHEIQNPLNFVNNFSEVNGEMVDELQQELRSGNVDEAIAISNDIKENEEKINHHGKRADAIVKGMLQHSRKSFGVKELTDINALCDEYLRLSFHGMRAKDKSFYADFKTDFDESIGKINVVPQDIGRVLLNLYNNAFYAVNEKKKTDDENYQPIVSVQTEKINNRVEIKVTDNGNGIPQNIVDKIFQPFFTTKPTGEGTGLGLSLSYDIIKANGGEIKVETKAGEGSEFIVQLAKV